MVSLAELCTNLRLRHGEDKWDLSKLPKLSKIVARYTKIKPDKLRPILGEHAFTHKADLHVKAVIENPECYEVIPPSKFGLKRTISYI